MVDFYEYSTPELVRLLGNRFKEYRIRCNLTQKDVSGVSPTFTTNVTLRLYFHRNIHKLNL